MVGSRLRLVRRVGVDHGVGHQADESVGDLPAGLFAPDVLEVVGGRGDHRLQAIAFRLVLGFGQGPTVLHHQPGDGPILALDDVAHQVALLVADVHSVAEIGSRMMQGGEFVDRGVYHPGARRQRQRIRRTGVRS